MVFQGVEAPEDPVMEVLLAQLLPERFLRVQFGGIGRQEQ
jgi:hypothetical protein